MKRVIAYDLIESKDYGALYEVLDKFNKRKLSKSVYEINTSASQNDIIRQIADVIDDDDVVHYISVDGKTHQIFARRIRKF